ncbi:glycoside hydrolase superfamily [Aspergillus cavernicola]|uniref:chitinase n=1 Tax=Aspergillus cavernicola TaxID=176166 RepID=A0ABR4H9M3_9EURO
MLFLGDILAAECGISLVDFRNYNPGSTFCDDLKPGQHVCCSSGMMPDFCPQLNPNRTCAAYYVKKGENCLVLGAANSLTNKEIESFNKDTWVWEGCRNMQVYQYICLSLGVLPIPVPIANTSGPGTSLLSLNPCLLNACCVCINKDFYTKSESVTGILGISAPNKNSCISNCGTEIIMGNSPAEYINVGYFEVYNLDYPCLNMKITAMDLMPYIYIYLVFGHWELFLQLSGFKKILLLSSWSFSAEPGTYHIFCDVVKLGNQDIFIMNIVLFVTEHDLDGIDIDWECKLYGSCKTDSKIETAKNTENYHAFFTKLQAAMSLSKSILFCMLALYWYLQGYYKLDKIAALADYIIYMTYDLYGQWDYANKHTNITKTILALSMITKTSILIIKLAITISGCTGPMCTYTSRESGAYPGPCTGTAGYIANAEINAILDRTGTWKDSSGALQLITFYKLYFNKDSQSNIAVYKDT